MGGQKLKILRKSANKHFVNCTNVACPSGSWYHWFKSSDEYSI